MSTNKTFFEIITILQKYWIKQGCIMLQGLDIPIGAGTFHLQTFFNAIHFNPISIAYTQTCRRPADGRFAKNSNRTQQHFQFQVIIKPPKNDIQELYINSLKELSIDPNKQDLRFIEDNWENPTLGASGVGWEVRINGMEITQFTYFQQMGSLDCNPITVEITYGLERIAMHLQNTNNIFNIQWMSHQNTYVSYQDLFYQNEKEQSFYNFTYSNTNLLLNLFKEHLNEAKRLLMLDDPLLFPAYEHILLASHNFNLLDARKILSSIERQNYIFKIRNLTKKIAILFRNQQII